MAGPDEAVTEGEGYAKQRPEGSATAPRAAACGGKRRQRPQRSEPCSPPHLLGAAGGRGRPAAGRTAPAVAARGRLCGAESGHGDGGGLQGGPLPPYPTRGNAGPQCQASWAQGGGAGGAAVEQVVAETPPWACSAPPIRERRAWPPANCTGVGEGAVAHRMFREIPFEGSPAARGVRNKTTGRISWDRKRATG